MWKKLIKSTKFLFSKSIPSPSSGTTLAQSFEVLSRKRKGHSQPPRSAPSLSKEQIMELKLSPVTKLNVQEIEILARELFRGGEYVEQDKTEAVLLWAKGCALGSVSCCYNYATSLRQGIGVAKDERKSFNILLELADEHRHAVAHVCLYLYLSSLYFSMMLLSWLRLVSAKKWTMPSYSNTFS